MYKSSWGQKRVCPCTKIQYYDLGRSKLECPECGKMIEVTNIARPRRGRKPGSLSTLKIVEKPPVVVTKPKNELEEDLNIENIDIESDETSIEDDSVLIEEDTDIDPAFDAGIKPTSGRVPRTGHCISYDAGATESFTQNGPMARRVEDLFPILEVISGPDWIDPYVVPMPLISPSTVDVSSLKIAFHTDNDLMTPIAEIQENVAMVAKYLEKLGCSVAESKPSALSMLDEMDNKYSTGDGREWVKRLLERAGTKKFSPFMEGRLAEANPISTPEFTEILETVDVYRSKMTSFFQDYDVIVCPSSAKAALGPGEFLAAENKFVYSYTSAYNVTGWPAGVVRSGQTLDGLPISVQVIAKPWHEHIALAVMEQIESEYGGWTPPNLAHI